MEDRTTDVAEAARGRVVRDADRDHQGTSARVVHAKLKTPQPLSLDDSDFGTDPYNHTGRFTSLKKD